MIRKIFFLCSIAFFLSATSHAFSRKQVTPDKVMDAILADDVTGIVEGCGAQPIVGFTYCRVVEGDVADQSISFIGPPAKCDKEACVFVQVLNQAGQIVWGSSIPKGQTRVSIPWQTLLGSDQFQLGNHGKWTWNLAVFWIDNDDHERVSTAQGDILLRVYKKGYVPLDKVSDDPNFVWSWSDNGRSYRMTTGLRAYVSPKKE